nr:unnamed protein product [Digitaria exilis]
MRRSSPRPQPAAAASSLPISRPSVVQRRQERSEKLVAAVAESASALTLREEESITAIPGTIPHITIDCSSSASPFNQDKFVAGAAESSSSQTLQERDVLSSDELHDAASMEETIIVGPQTVPHDTIDGSSSTSRSRFQKLVEGFAETAQTSQEHSSYLEELLDAVLEGSMGARLRSVLQDTTCSSPTRASSIRSSILSRSPPNWYEVFYISMDHEGSFYMYPDLGGPFPCIDEADIAIKRYLSELQSGARCKDQGNLNIVDRMVDNCKYYLDGTARRGPNSPRKNYDEKRYLVQALLDQYSDDHNLVGNLELEDILMRRWFCEDLRWFFHFNFTTKKREADDDPAAGRLFFAEVSHMQEDVWEVNCCCMIEDEDNGVPYSSYLI